MKKYAYLAKLEELLAALPPQKRQEILSEYAARFDAAGAGQEEEAAAKLGDPETVARKILEEQGTEAPAETSAASAAGGNAAKPGDAAATADAASATRFAGRRIVLPVVGAAVLLALGIGLLLGARSGESKRVSAESAASSQISALAPAETSSAAPSPSAATPETPASDAAEAQFPGTTTSYDIELNTAAFVLEFDPDASDITLLTQNISEGELQAALNERGELHIRERETGAGTAAQNRVVTLVLPAAATISKLDLTVGAGSAQLPDLTVGELDIEVGSGSATLQSIAAGQVDLTVASGTLTAASVTAQQADVEVASGEVSVAVLDAGAEGGVEVGSGQFAAGSLSFTRELDLECGSGRLALTLTGSADGYALQAETAHGTIQYGDEALTGNTVRGSGSARIEAECGAGSLVISFAQ